MTAGRKEPILRALKGLEGRRFKFTRWTSRYPEWTHDHCRGCRVHICGAEDGDIHEAYVTLDSDEEWVCPKCFELYHLVLKFKVQNS